MGLWGIQLLLKHNKVDSSLHQEDKCPLQVEGKSRLLHNNCGILALPCQGFPSFCADKKMGEKKLPTREKLSGIYCSLAKFAGLATLTNLTGLLSLEQRQIITLVRFKFRQDFSSVGFLT